MSENWRKLKILPSEQLRLIELLEKYGVQIITDEIECLEKEYRFKK